MILRSFVEQNQLVLVRCFLFPQKKFACLRRAIGEGGLKDAASAESFDGNIEQVLRRRQERIGPVLDQPGRSRK